MYKNNTQDREEARMRLSDTIIRYGKMPIFCQSVDEEGMLSYRELGSGETQRVRFTDSSLNFKPVPLGYTQLDNLTCGYVSRMPSRHFKCGMSITRLAYISNNSSSIRTGGSITGGADIENRIKDTILGIFPDIGKAYTKVMKNGGESAFSRKFCLKFMKGSVLLFHKGNKVGKVNTSATPTLNSKFEYLKETLREEMR